nr:double homeobox protein 4C-like [Ovis aries]
MSTCTHGPGSSSTSSGPVATGSRRRRLVLRLSQKDALQALFQQNPYPGIATRERLARELGIAESRVQVWFQNQRRRRFKQSRSPPEHVHQEGEAGPTSTPAPPSRPPRPQSSSPGNLASALPIASPQEGPEPSPLAREFPLPETRPERPGERGQSSLLPKQASLCKPSGGSLPGDCRQEELARQTGIPEPRIQGPRMRLQRPCGSRLGLTDQRPGGQAGCRMGAAQAPARYGFKTEELGTPAEPERARRRSSHDSSCSRGPKDPTRGPEHLSSLRPSPPQESMPPSAAPAAPFGAPAFWVPGTAPGVCVGQPLMIFMVQPSPGALWPSGKPPPPAQVAGPWAVSSPAGTASGSLGKGPSCRLHSRRHTSRAGRGSPPRSEPLSRQEGPTPPSRFPDHVHVYTRARYASKGQSLRVSL